MHATKMPFPAHAYRKRSGEWKIGGGEGQRGIFMETQISSWVIRFPGRETVYLPKWIAPCG